MSDPPVWAVNLFAMHGFEVVLAPGETERWTLVKGDRRSTVRFSFIKTIEWYIDHLATHDVMYVLDWEANSVPHNT